MAYRLVLLDADDTLFEFRKAVAEALPALFTQFGFPWDPAKDLDRYHAANSQVWDEMRSGRLSYADLKVDRFRRMLPGKDLDYEAMSRGFLALLVQFSHMIDGAEEVCRVLSAKCTLAIVSNGLPETQRDRIRLSSLRQFIPQERVFVAEEVGFRKPDPRMFKHVFDALGNPDKSEVIMVGDSLKEDIQGGIVFGIHTCWYNRDGLEIPRNIRPTFVIGRLRELIDLV